MTMITDQYAAINQVRWLFDGIICVEHRPKSSGCPAPIAIYQISTRDEPTSGFRSMNLTPGFLTMEELEKFCTENLARFKELSHLHIRNDAPLPETLFWSEASTAVA